jgi:hypothetical protein
LYEDEGANQSALTVFWISSAFLGVLRGERIIDSAVKKIIDPI